jgi:AraC-like DNA-binding protein
MKGVEDPRRRFLEELGHALLGDDLFDAVPDTVFFIKDRDGRYVAVNRTLVERTGRRHKGELVGRTATDVFPGALGRHIAEQDIAVVRDGKPIHGELELHLYPGGEEGWCLTWKEPIIGRGGKVIGLCGISRDVRGLDSAPAETKALSAVLNHVRRHIDTPLRLADLAARAGLSVFQLDQRIRALFGLSAGQFVTRARIERACDRLRSTDEPISRIALDCGYGDQAAFARQFRKSVGLTPGQYKLHARAHGPGA